MLYEIIDGSVSIGGELILSHINLAIKGSEKIAIVGPNGAGKTTLLRLLAGELTLDRDDKQTGKGIWCSRSVTIGMLKQQTEDGGLTVGEELLKYCPCKDIYDKERYLYEMEYDRLFTGFGFSKEDKRKYIRDFSGGEQTKIAMIRLFLQKPDILLLDEPTNHLDLETSEWLEEYLKAYDGAVVMVSHDRFFLDETAEVIYELEDKQLNRYPGNYTAYRSQKEKQQDRRQKAYERQQQEIKRLEDLIERFKHKPKKAAFARAKKKQIERMERIEAPAGGGRRMAVTPLIPEITGSKWVVEAQHLQIGYDKTLFQLSLRIRRGQKIGIIGANGVGKSAFLKTIAGLIPLLKGECRLGNEIVMGYYDQHTAAISSEQTVIEYFHDQFPSMTEKELRSCLGAYLFGGSDAAKQISSLSGGEKSRLMLAALLQSRPNFLLLDEPTNHMDIQAKEVFEEVFSAYQGTVLFVSHDRYFVSQVADAILIVENQSVSYYPFGYRHYVERRRKTRDDLEPAARIKAEEQALIAGIKAVPRPERHRLREIPEEEAYLDWQLRLAGERMKMAAKAVEVCLESLEHLSEESDIWHEIDVHRQELSYKWEHWNTCCVEWYEFFEQIPESVKRSVKNS